ncbi:Reverse transcriptase zinc-binding domain [Arabidopsis suecica]|uniref:Reverse transcriptase zinc-binding domain n=1 Tax=Arabidopsis suecica TaxID=45249 RepID=A0A8T1YNL0_ARASU|nr:Reverse transcriptase zinc-binding domain [Arabidopsis suecica]
MDVSLSSNPSHGWRGILAGREVIRKGLGRIVGNGESINVWKDAWLSTTTPLSPFGPATEIAQSLKVCDLLLEDNTWNVSAIRSHLPQYEDFIRKLRPSSLKTEDSFAWLPDKSGVYSSKSGYRLIKKNKVSSLQETFSWTSSVWKVQTSPKLKNFLWKIAAGALPVGEQLASRGIHIPTACKRCGAAESLCHLFLHCPYAKKVWSLAPVLFGQALLSQTVPRKLLEVLKQSINLPPTGISSSPLYPWILWNLWTARNQFLFADKLYTEKETIHKAIQDAKAWHQATHPELEQSPASSVATLGRTPNVGPPLPNSVFLETDAAWKEELSLCGLGWIGRDEESILCFQDSGTESFVASALQAEALAIKAGLKSAIDKGFSSVHLKSDSKIIIDLLCSGKVCNELVGLLHDIRAICSELVSYSFSFIPRSANTRADDLAKRALSALVVSSSVGT